MPGRLERQRDVTQLLRKSLLRVAESVVHWDIAESVVHWDTTTPSSIHRKKMHEGQVNNWNISLIRIYFRNKTAVIAN